MLKNIPQKEGHLEEEKRNPLPDALNQNSSQTGALIE